MSKDAVKPGETTSEYKIARSGALWGTIATVLGTLVSSGSIVADALGADTKWGIIAGAVIALAGLMKNTLSDLGYINSRTVVKKADSEAK